MRKVKRKADPVGDKVQQQMVRQMLSHITGEDYRPETLQEESEREYQEQEDISEGEKLGWTLDDAKNWRQALRKWRKANKPTRTDGEVLSIVEMCETCDEYHADERRCGKCRCCISRKGMAVFNKARLGTESCPLGKWPQTRTDKQ